MNIKNLIKQICYGAMALLATISTFLVYSKLSAAAASSTDPVSVGTAAATSASLEAMGKDSLSFFEYIGQFTGDTKTSTVFSALFLVLAILAVGIMLYIVVMSLVKRDAEVLDEMHIKWVSVAAFACALISLLIAVIFPVPESTDLVKFTASIGVGSILFLVATGLSTIFAFVHPLIFKDNK